MKNNRIHSLLTVSVVGLLSGGCASKNVLFFGTDTSLGLNVSGTTQVPSKVSFAYERSEIAFVPRNPGGPAHSVLGTLDADINFWDKKSIHQVFTIGQAAENYANSQAGLLPEVGDESFTQVNNVGSRESLVFVTHSSIGLKLAAGEGAVAPSLLLGFRRGEAALVPVRDGEKVRSVFGELSFSTNAATFVPAPDGVVVPSTALGGVRIKQVFATGRAAKVYAVTKQGMATINAAIGDTVVTASHDMLAVIKDSVNAYKKAQTAKDAAALAAFDAAAHVAIPAFSTAVEFFGKIDKTPDQAKKFEAAAKGDARSSKYFN